jgi:hypothetical protein
MSITPETLSALLGAAISLCATYVPGFKAWFANLEANQKRLVMLGALLFMAAAWAVVLGVQGMPWQDAAKIALGVFVSAAVGSQVTFLLTPKPK